MRHILFVFMFLVFSTAYINTQPCGSFSHGWTTGLAPMPDGATNASRVIPSGIIINDTPYVFIMGGGTPVNLNRRYNTIANTWSTMAPLPISLATTTGARVKDSIYIVGGYLGSSGTSGATYKYDPVANTWTTRAPMPSATKTADMVVVTWRDSIIICVGGGTGLFNAANSVTNEVRYYNPYTNTWTNLTGSSLFPIPLGMMGGAIIGDTIYTFGGYTNTPTTVNSAYKGIITPGNPLTITWTSIAPLPSTIGIAGAVYRPACAAIFGITWGVLFLSGGNGTTYNGTAYLYNPCGSTYNTYTTLTSTTGSNKNNLGSHLPAFRDSVVYMIGGYSSTGQPTNIKIAARCYDCLITGINGNNSEVPTDYALAQNYPNPFNPSTKISFQLPKGENVNLVITDVTGREVALLVNEFKPAGYYDIEINGDKLSSGVYFYTLTAGDFRATKKMVLLK